MAIPGTGRRYRGRQPAWARPFSSLQRKEPEGERVGQLGVAYRLLPRPSLHTTSTRGWGDLCQAPGESPGPLAGTPPLGAPSLPRAAAPAGSHLHLAVDPGEDFRHFGVHTGLVPLATARAPASDSGQVPAAVLLTDQGPPAVSLGWGSTHINAVEEVVLKQETAGA